jgi:hypothetical protein
LLCEQPPERTGLFKVDLFLVAKGDEHHSVARIATLNSKNRAVSEEDEHNSLCVRHFQRRNVFLQRRRVTLCSPYAMLFVTFGDFE